MNEILKLHCDGDYVSRIEGGGNQIVISFPINLKYGLDYGLIGYVIKDGVVTKSDTHRTVKIDNCPNYAVRLLILTDIMLELEKRKLNTFLVVIEKDKELFEYSKELFFSLIDIDINKEDEEELNKGLINIIMNRRYECPDNIKDGYKLLKKYIGDKNVN